MHLRRICICTVTQITLPYRYKAKEIESMRNKVTLPMLKAMTNSAPPARDFKAAILKRAAETGVFACVCVGGGAVR